MDTLIQDLRYGFRMLLKRPGFTIVIVLTLALGIGANTAIFSMVNAVLLRPLPYPDPDRLIMVRAFNPQLNQETGAAPGNILDWRAQNTAFEGMAAWYTSTMIHRDDFGAEMVTNAFVTEDFFPVIQRQPLIGRMFTEEENMEGRYTSAGRYLGTVPAVMVSHGFWQRKLGADPNITDRTIALDGVAFRVVGVMPASFALPDRQVDIWVPWDMARSYAHLERFREGPPRDSRFLRVLVRLKEGVSVEEAQGQLGVMAASLAVAHPKENEGWSVRLTSLHDTMVGDTRPVLWSIFGAVGFVLLLACANVANMLLVRAAGRRHELSVRTALGASQKRIFRQLITESLLLALIGGGAGLMIAFWSMDAIVAMTPADIPRIDAVSLDGTVLGFALLISLITGLLFGLAPGFQNAFTVVADSLRTFGARGTTGGRRPIRHVLMIMETAMALVLLVGAGLLIRSFINLTQVDHGFNADNLLVMRMSLDTRAYRTNEQALTYFQQLTDRIEALPGVQSVGGTTSLPMSDVGSDFDRPYWRTTDPTPAPGEAPEVYIRMVRPGYFATMQTPLIRGNTITNEHREGSPRVIMINRTLADRAWPGEDPVGRHLTIDYQRGAYPYEVIGVVEDMRHYGPRSTPNPEAFIPHAQNVYRIMNMVIRTDGPPQALIQSIRRTTAALDPAQPIHSLMTMHDLSGDAVKTDRFAVVLFGVLAGIALVLAVVGVYAVMSHATGMRIKEIGIRMALGAQPAAILSLILKEGILAIAVGMLIGLAATLGLTHLMSDLLFGVAPTDPATFITVGLLLMTVTVIACTIPAHRATGVDPSVTLRDE